MKKILLSIAAAFITMGAMAQNTIDLTFNRDNSAAGTDATVTVGNTGDVDITGIASTVVCNYQWKSLSANSTTFPTASILCPNENTKLMKNGNEGVITFTLTGVPFNYEINKVTFTSVALNAGGAFQGDNANAQEIDFILLNQSDTKIAKQNRIAIKVNSNGGESVVVNLTPEAAIRAENGTVTFKLKLVNNYTENGCFYGLFKVSLTTDVKPTAYTISDKLTAADLMNATEPTYIAIRNLSYTNNRWFVGNTGAVPYSKEEFTEDAVFVWEPVTAGTAGSYRLRKLNGDYMQTSAPKDFGTVDAAATFTAIAPSGTAGTFNSDDDSNLYIKGDDDANLVRFVKGSNWINVQNGAGGTPTYNTGQGGWTIHYVYGVTEVMDFSANITGAGYSTFYAPANVEIPEGVNAYYITSEGINTDYVSMTEITGVIPANTAVILEGAEDNYTFNVSDAEVTAVSNNLLKGTVESTNVIGDAYVLSNPSEGVGLYKTQMTEIQLSTTSGKVNVFLNNAGKAYLPASAVPATAQASNGFRFGEGTTGISEVKGESGNVKVIFDLTGRKVENITAPGIYVVNGKKVLVK